MLRARMSIRFMLILVAAIALILGLLSRRLQQQREALSLLQNLGGQLEAPTLGPLTLLTGMTVDNVRFLGPMIGDQEVPEIGNAAAILRLSRITLLETSVSDRGFAGSALMKSPVFVALLSSVMISSSAQSVDNPALRQAYRDHLRMRRHEALDLRWEWRMRQPPARGWTALKLTVPITPYIGYQNPVAYPQRFHEWVPGKHDGRGNWISGYWK
jgi:hypothetical protein